MYTHICPPDSHTASYSFPFFERSSKRLARLWPRGGAPHGSDEIRLGLRLHPRPAAGGQAKRCSHSFASGWALNRACKYSDCVLSSREIASYGQTWLHRVQPTQLFLFIFATPTPDLYSTFAARYAQTSSHRPHALHLLPVTFAKTGVTFSLISEGLSAFFNAYPFRSSMRAYPLRSMN